MALSIMCTLTYTMSLRSKQKPVKSGEEKSWFGKIKSALYPTNYELPPKQKRTYQLTSEDQVRKMYRLRKENPNLSVDNIAKSCDISDAVCQYWFEQLASLGEKVVLSNFKAKEGRKLADQQRKERVRIAEEKQEKKRLRKLNKKAKSATPPTVTFASPETEKEISLSTFAQLSDIEGQKILKKIDRVEKHPTHVKASPDWFEGALPSQAVAGKEEWIVEERKYKIGKAVMHKKIKEKENEENRKDRLEKSHKDPKTRPKIHSDQCPSCNRNSKLTLDEYKIWHFKEYVKRKEFAIKKQQKQLDQRAKQLTEMERDSLTVADRAKDGLELCLRCSTPITYSQSTRTSNIWGAGQYYCADHEPPKPKGDKK